MAAHFVRDIREIPLRVLNRRVGDEHVTLLQACYDNPLFDEDGKTYNGGKAVNQDTKAYSRSKDYMHTLPAQQHEAKFKSNKFSRKKRLWVIGFIILTIIVVAVVIGLLAHYLGESKTTQEISTTPLPVISNTDVLKGSLRIIKGPFSIYTPNLKNKSSPEFKYLAKSFHYKMKSIFQQSDFSSNFNSTEIILISPGSVVINFKMHFNRQIAVTDAILTYINTLINTGLENSLLVIDKSSLNVFTDELILTLLECIQRSLAKPMLRSTVNLTTAILQPIKAIIVFTTRPVPQESCEPVRLNRCVNKTDYNLTAFPNFLGQVSQQHLLSVSSRYDIMFREPCIFGYENDFWCNVMVPPCHNGNPLPPCRSYCEEVFSKCHYPSNLTWPFECSKLPESNDPDVCRPNPFIKLAGKCVPINNPQHCKADGRQTTTFPNVVGDMVESQTHNMIELLNVIYTSTNCYKHVMKFACYTFQPQCSGKPVPNHYIPPCRSLCQGFKDRCEIFMDIFNMPWPKSLNCSELPDSNDTTICIGYKEAHEPEEQKVCKHPEIKCDKNVCIPNNWLCDNNQDCADGKDEDSCARCTDDEFSCSPASAQCIPSVNVCDGKTDCYDEVDESECAKLISDENHFKLEVLNSRSLSVDQWEEVCSDGWNNTHSNIVCKQLGYSHVSSTLLSPGSGKPKLVLTDPSPNSNPKLIQSYLTQQQCSSNMVVKLVCEDPVCGTRPAYHKPLLRIVNGDEVSEGSLPWLVALTGGLDETFFCGASIINERWLVTAAHCVGGGDQNLGAWTMKAGATRRNTYSRHRQVRKAKGLYAHPDFRAVDNDIALIQIDQPWIFTDYVRPICLPPAGEGPPVGSKCLVAGWGKPSETATYYMRAMQQLYLDVVDWDMCKHTVENVKDIKNPYKVSKNMFCAGGTLDHDSCSGDSGGPFLCRKPNSTDQWEQMGVVSWGVGCAKPNVPAMYTVLPHYIKWIEEMIANHTDTT